MELGVDDDLLDDLQSISFTSTETTVHRSRSSDSSSATITPAPSTHTSFSTKLFSTVALSDLHFSRRLGSGDIGSVYLAEHKAHESTENEHQLFAAKVMNKNELATRNKERRARREKEILEMLDHPFLPTLYASIESPKCLCFLTEFCPGGDLHILRQRQPDKRFLEPAVRFYASEVVAALEYLHMLGIVYRDLKPENVLVRSDGHIMLTDFDLSLRCDDCVSTPQIYLDQHRAVVASKTNPRLDQRHFSSASCMIPSCIVPAVSCFNPKRKWKKKTPRHCAPEFVVEPLEMKSMSFVGTHEYLAPEVVSGEGHGSPVDWWTLGIFMFELFCGITPFRGLDHELTLANIIARALEFPKEPAVPAMARDLILQLLVKDPVRRMGSSHGASSVKNHPFFRGVNWALLRCTSPPYTPPPYGRNHVSDEINVDGLLTIDFF